MSHKPIFKFCPFHDNQHFAIKNGTDDQCTNDKCRFCIEGKCAIIANYLLLRSLAPSLKRR